MVVLERAAAVGGMAGSFEVAGIRVDYGSHRLHRVLEPRLEAELAELLGDDLQRRTRRGRISLEGALAGVPAAPRRPRQEAAQGPRGPDRRRHRSLGPLRTSEGRGRRLGDRGPARAAPWPAPSTRRTCASCGTRRSTSCPPSWPTAGSRPAAGSSVVKKALAARKGEGGGLLPVPAPRLRPDQRGRGRCRGRRRGRAAPRGGGHLRRPRRAGRDRPAGRRIGGGGQHGAVEHPGPGHRPARRRPRAVLEAAGRLRHRAMVLAYLVLDADRLTAFDAHYFPELSTPVSRMSEPKNFRDADDPAGVTVVCAELACWEGDDIWNASADELGRTGRRHAHAARLRLPDGRPPCTCGASRVATRSTRAPTPRTSATVEAWAAGEPRLITFGRQGLFAPDNTHHALLHGLGRGGVDRPRRHRRPRPLVGRPRVVPRQRGGGLTCPRPAGSRWPRSPSSSWWRPPS